MGIQYRRRVKTGKNSWINLSGRGASGSAKFGPLTVNSRGRTSFRIAPGLAYRGGCAMPFAILLGIIAFSGLVLKG